MEIRFTDDDENLLGNIVHNDFTEILIPAYKADSFDMFLKHVFVSQPAVRSWQIINISIGSNLIDVRLKEAEHAISLVEFAESQNKNPRHYIRPFRLVEVEFGFYSNLFNLNGVIDANIRHTNSLLAGEMHKRRPCIVLGESKGVAQVIPLSTKRNVEHDPRNILMSKGSFLKLASRYSEKESYALLGMIQSVSIKRIMPPRAASGKFENNYSLYEITSGDRERVKNGLAEQYNQALSIQVENLQGRIDKLNKERARMLDGLQRVNQDLKSAQVENEKIRAFVLRVGKVMGAGDSLEEIMDYDW